MATDWAPRLEAVRGSQGLPDPGRDGMKLILLALLLGSTVGSFTCDYFGKRKSDYVISRSIGKTTPSEIVLSLQSYTTAQSTQMAFDGARNQLRYKTSDTGTILLHLDDGTILEVGSSKTAVVLDITAPRRAYLFEGTTTLTLRPCVEAVVCLINEGTCLGLRNLPSACKSLDLVVWDIQSASQASSNDGATSPVATGTDLIPEASLPQKGLQRQASPLLEDVTGTRLGEDDVNAPAAEAQSLHDIWEILGLSAPDQSSSHQPNGPLHANALASNDIAQADLAALGNAIQKFALESCVVLGSSARTTSLLGPFTIIAYDASTHSYAIQAGIEERPRHVIREQELEACNDEILKLWNFYRENPHFEQLNRGDQVKVAIDWNKPHFRYLLNWMLGNPYCVENITESGTYSLVSLLTGRRVKLSRNCLEPRLHQRVHHHWGALGTNPNHKDPSQSRLPWAPILPKSVLGAWPNGGSPLGMPKTRLMPHPPRMTPSSQHVSPRPRGDVWQPAYDTGYVVSSLTGEVPRRVAPSNPAISSFLSTPGVGSIHSTSQGPVVAAQSRSVRDKSILHADRMPSISLAAAGTAPPSQEPLGDLANTAAGKKRKSKVRGSKKNKIPKLFP